MNDILGGDWDKAKSLMTDDMAGRYSAAVMSKDAGSSNVHVGSDCKAVDGKVATNGPYGSQAIAGQTYTLFTLKCDEKYGVNYVLIRTRGDEQKLDNVIFMNQREKDSSHLTFKDS